jgi:hypothetical protein
VAVTDAVGRETYWLVETNGEEYQNTPVKTEASEL